MPKSLLALTGFTCTMIALGGCAAPRTPTPTLTPAPPATITPIPTVTITPTPRATATSTLAPTIAPTFTPTLGGLPRQLRTGEVVIESEGKLVDFNNENRFNIENNQSLDAVVVMVCEVAPVSRYTRAVRGAISAVYIRQFETFRKQGISDGTYWVFIMQGEDWDSAAATFTRKLELLYLGRATWTTREVQGGTQYTIYNISLPFGGTPIPASDFPKLK